MLKLWRSPTSQRYSSLRKLGSDWVIGVLVAVVKRAQGHRWQWCFTLCQVLGPVLLGLLDLRLATATVAGAPSSSRSDHCVFCLFLLFVVLILQQGTKPKVKMSRQLVISAQCQRCAHAQIALTCICLAQGFLSPLLSLRAILCFVPFWLKLRQILNVFATAC